MGEMTEFNIFMGIIMFWLFVPLFLGAINYNGYTSLNTELYQEITSSNFKLLSITGFNSAVQFFFEIGIFSIANAPVWVNVFFVFMFLITIVIFIYYFKDIITAIGSATGGIVSVISKFFGL